MKNENTVPAVDKTLEIMEMLCYSEQGLSQSEIARKSRTSVTTCYRILQTLMSHGWVRKISHGHYGVTHLFFALAQTCQDRALPLDQLRPVLTRLSEETGLGCKLSIRRHKEQVTILRAESPGPFSISVRVGKRFPIIEGTVGAALLSQETPAALTRLVRECSEPIEEHFNEELLGQRIAFLKEHGYLVSEKVNRWNIKAMSSPIPGRDGVPVAALTLLGVSEDFVPTLLPGLVQGMKQAVKEAMEVFA